MMRFFKITIIFTIASWVTAQKETINENVCTLQYKQSAVSNKPDLLTMNVLMAKTRFGICRIRSSDTQSTLPDYNIHNYTLLSGLNYDPQEQTIYYAAMGALIYKTQLNDNKEEIVYTLNWDDRQIFGIIYNIAYDWVNRNCYVQYRNVMGLVDFKTQNVRVLRNESYDNIAVHPYHGYLFLHTRNNIFRTNLNGSDLMLVVNVTETYKPNHQIAEIASIALDVEENRLYWLVTPSTEIMRHSALDGSDEKRFASPVVYTSRAIAIGKTHVYYSNSLQSLISRFDKKTGTYDEDFYINNGKTISLAMVILPENAPTASDSTITTASDSTITTASDSTITTTNIKYLSSTDQQKSNAASELVNSIPVMYLLVSCTLFFIGI